MSTPSGITLSQCTDLTAQEDGGVLVHLDDPITGEPAYYASADGPRPVTILVAGSYSKRFQEAEARRMAKWAKARRVPKGTELQDSQVETAAACVLAWDGIFDQPAEQGGTALPCTTENALRLFTMARAVYQQVWEAMHDHERFFGTRSAS